MYAYIKIIKDYLYSVMLNNPHDKNKENNRNIKFHNFYMHKALLPFVLIFK